MLSAKYAKAWDRMRVEIGEIVSIQRQDPCQFVLRITRGAIHS
jgi:hypothetical protein